MNFGSLFQPRTITSAATGKTRNITKKLGRPPGSKNKPKVGVFTTSTLNQMPGIVSRRKINKVPKTTIGRKSNIVSASKMPRISAGAAQKAPRAFPPSLTRNTNNPSKIASNKRVALGLKRGQKIRVNCAK